MSPQLSKVVMRLGQILAVGVFAFVKVRNSVESKSIYAQGQPEIADLLHCLMHGRVIEIQIRLMRIKPMPIIRLCDRVPRPVRCFKVFEDDSRVLVFLRTVAPDVEILVSKIIVAVAGGAAPGRLRRCSCAPAISARGYNAVFPYSASGFLEPGILLGRVIDYQFDNDAQITLMCGVKE